MKFFFDFLPVLLFFVAYKLAGIYVATAVAIAAAVLQSGYLYVRHRRLERMQLLVLVLIVVLGGLTLLFRDPNFIKWKPTLVNWGFGLAFLGSELIGGKNLLERMLSEQVKLPKAIWRRLNLAWVVFFTAVGALNLYVAYGFNLDTWVNFKLYGMIGLTVAFAVLQALYLARHLPNPDKAETKEN